MKEMVYTTKSKREILDTGYCLGFLYYIMNLGTHPTAYIRIPKEHKYYERENIDLPVNGGVTYANNQLWIGENQKVKGWFIGWDYAHYGDYFGCEELVPEQFRTGGKKWTTEEIYKEVRDACYNLNKVED